MIEYDFLTRNCKDKKKFKQIYDKRVELKKAGKKKEQAPYKIILNSTYGICKDKYSNAYDPRQANNVCINGQLMLLDLLEHLEGHAEIIQSNTDGIILQVEDNPHAIQTMKDICQEWMDRTKMGLGFDEIDEIWQKDVNNYIVSFSCQKDVNELKSRLKEVYPDIKQDGYELIF
jgi:DNA polymerase elongation subunit (family B)